MRPDTAPTMPTKSQPFRHRTRIALLIAFAIGLLIGASVVGLPLLIATWGHQTDVFIGKTSDEAARVQGWMSIAQTVLQAFTFALGAILTVMLYLGTSQFAKFQFLRSNYDAWKDLDSFLLGHPDYLPLAASLGDPGDGSAYLTRKKREQAKKKHLAFLMLNPYYSYFYAIKGGHVNAEMTTKFDEQMTILIADDEIFRLTQENVFVEGFQEHCKALRDALDRQRNTQDTAKER